VGPDGPTQFGRERDPRTRASLYLASPCRASVLPRRSALIPSYLGTHHTTGCLFPSSPPFSLSLSLSLSLVSLSSLPVGAAVQHPLISLAGLLLESSGSHPPRTPPQILSGAPLFSCPPLSRDPSTLSIAS